MTGYGIDLAMHRVADGAQHVGGEGLHLRMAVEDVRPPVVVQDDRAAGGVEDAPRRDYVRLRGAMGDTSGSVRNASASSLASSPRLR